MATPNYLFNVEKKTKLRRNVFSLSHNNKTTANFGQLIPIDLFPVLPGDTHNVHANIFARMAPAISPFLHEVNIYTWSFFIPNRLSWNDWEDFITDGVQGPTNPLVGTDKQFPKFKIDLYDLDDDPASMSASRWIGFVEIVPESYSGTPSDLVNGNYVSAVVFHGGGFGNVGSIFDYMGIPPIEGSPYFLKLQEDLHRVVSRTGVESRMSYSTFLNRHYFSDLSSYLAQSGSPSTWKIPAGTILGPTTYIEPSGKSWNMTQYVGYYDSNGKISGNPIPDDFPIVSMRGKYMMIPFGDTPGRTVATSALDSRGSSLEKLLFSAIPFDCYLHVYNEYFRDQNLEEPYHLLSDGPRLDDGSILYNEADGVVLWDYVKQFGYPFSKCWEKDYFTSALPWAQRGGAAELPITGIDGAPLNFITPGTGASSYLVQRGGSTAPVNTNLVRGDSVTGSTNGSAYIARANVPDTVFDINNAANLTVNGESVSGPTVNDLRRVVAIQQLLEASARGGSRYIEQILTIFGVRGSDSRFQRPEYLGGGKQPLTVGEVLQTSESNNTPQANPAGRGYTIGNKNGFKRYFNEHGYVLTLMAIVPRSSYMQGLSKDWFKFDRYDFYWPQFAHLGEQEILRRELNAYADEGVGDSLFGYTPRYAEYKTRLNEVHGEFRTNLDFWHLARIFSGTPILDKDFVAINPQLQPHGELLNRVFAVQDDTSSHFWFDIQFKHRASRLMPLFGTPQLI